MTPSANKPIRRLKSLSLVIPLYNEEQVFTALRQRLEALVADLPVVTEIIMVSDGSTDLTSELIAHWAASEKRVKLVEFSRNFGHQFAITAGIDVSTSDAVVVMDGDLQDPPELIKEMVKEYERGFDVVYAQRVDRSTDTIFKRTSAKFFYNLMNLLLQRPMPTNVGDFRLMSRPFVEALCELREGHRYIRGLTVWAGFKQACIPMRREPRVAGKTKYPLRNLFKLGFDAILSFSGVPLRAVVFAGLVICLIGFGVGLHALYQKFSGVPVERGWTSLFVLNCFIGGFTLLALGAVGEYVARIYEETKRRPLYIVKRTINIKRKPERSRSVWSDEASEPRKLRIAK